MSFFTPNKEKFIVPDLLTTKEPTTTQAIRNTANKVQFVYDYDYLPKSVLPNIIVETHLIIKEYWRTGCVLQGKNAEALISSYKNQIVITVIGDFKEKRLFLAVIRHLIDEINSKLSKKPTEWIPVVNDTTAKISYRELLDKEKRGKKDIDVYNKGEFIGDFQISELLDGIPTPDEVLMNKIDEVIDYQEKILEVVKDNKAELNKIQSSINSLNSFDTNQLDELLTNKLNAFVKEIPDSEEIAQKWIELQNDNQSNVTSKAKVKAKLNFIIFEVEKEIAFDTKSYFDLREVISDLKKWINKDITTSELFIRKE